MFLMTTPNQTNRDPRQEPLPGDRVRARNRTRLVKGRAGNDVYYQVEEQANAHVKNCWGGIWPADGENCPCYEKAET